MCPLKIILLADKERLTLSLEINQLLGLGSVSLHSRVPLAMDSQIVPPDTSNLIFQEGGYDFQTNITEGTHPIILSRGPSQSILYYQNKQIGLRNTNNKITIFVYTPPTCFEIRKHSIVSKLLQYL